MRYKNLTSAESILFRSIGVGDIIEYSNKFYIKTDLMLDVDGGAGNVVNLLTGKPYYFNDCIKVCLRKDVYLTNI